MKLTDIIHQIGDRVRLAARVNGLTGGTRTVASVAVTAGGSGYSSLPAVGFTGGGGSGAAGAAVISGGQVIAVMMTGSGTGYTSAPAVSITGGGGSGAAAVAVMLAERLDAIPTAGVGISHTLFVGVLLDGLLSTYRLRAGADAESSPLIIRPDDHAPGANERVWELAGLHTSGIARARRTLTYAGSVALDFGGPELLDVTLAGDIMFSTSHRAAGRSITLRIAADAAPRALSFPAWRFVGGAAPSGIAAGRIALLRLTCWGVIDTDVTAGYSVEL